MSRIQNFTAIRAALFELQEGRCCYCGIEMQMPPNGELRKTSKITWRSRRWATIEHKVPRAKGGTHEMSNLALACHCCNQVRGLMLTHGFENFLRAHSKRVRAREMNR